EKALRPYEGLGESAKAGGDSGNRPMRGRQKGGKRKGKKTGSAYVCDKLYQCPAIVDRTTSVFRPVSCNVVYCTNLLIGKINAMRSGTGASAPKLSKLFPAQHARQPSHLEYSLCIAPNRQVSGNSP